jgi:hypothetical protein
MLYKSAGLGMAGCCDGRDTQACGWASSCVDFSSYAAGSCGSSCLLNTFVRKCTNVAAPYCVTWTYPSDGVKDFGCDSTSTNTVYTVRQTARDDFSSLTSTRLSTVTAGAVTNPTGTYNTPSQRTAKKVAVGTIVGIVIAVLTVLFFVIVAVCICLKRKKKQKQIAANAQIMANVHANRPESQFQPQMHQGPPPPMSPQSPQPHMSGYFPPPNPQEQKYNGHTSVQEYNTMSTSNPATPAPAYIQPYMASNAPPMPQQQGQYQAPANGAHEVASPMSQQYTGQYQAPLNGAHEVPSPDVMHSPQQQHVSPVQQSPIPPAGAHEVDATSVPHAPGKTGPTYEIGGK